MRVRQKDLRTNVDFSFSTTNNGCSPGANGGGTINIGTIGTFKRTIDVVTPNYHKRRNSGEVIINPFSSVFTQRWVTADGPSLTSTCPSGNPNYSAVFSGPYTSWKIGGPPTVKSLFSGSEIDKYRNVAATKCWSAVSKSEVQLLQTLADAKRTIELILGPLRNVHSFLTKVKTAKDAARAYDLTLANYMAREWLTYRFGWKQLYLDIRGTLRAVGKKEKLGTLSATGNVSNNRTETKTFVSFTTGDPTHYTFEETYTHEVRVRCGIFYEGNANVQSYLGLSKYDILPALWDIIPYSFVVDWVVDVQSYLGSLLPRLLIPVKGTYTTVSHIKNVTRVCTDVDPTYRSVPPSTIWSCTAQPTGSDIVLERSKDRVPTIPPANLVVNPKIRDLVDIRILDSIALVLNRLGSK